MKVIFAAVWTAMLLVACGGESQPTDSRAADKVSGAATARVEGAAAETPDAVSIALPTSPISLADALGRTLPVIRETASCPFLSDETARAAATSPYELVRRSVSNSACVWNYNVGFSVKVSVDPIAQARPFEDQVYNMDAKPVVETQASPGENAVLVYDTAWETPRPFGFGFELDGKRIFIRITGMKTSLAQLQRAADEITAKLPAAPRIEAQFREEVAAFDKCSTWSKDALLNVFNLPADTPYSATASGMACSFSMRPAGPSHNEIVVGLSAFEIDPGSVEKLKAKGDKEVTGYDYPVLSRNAEDKWGISAKLSTFVDDGSIVVSVNDKEGGREAELKALFDNVMGRLAP
jgi:hypothetical protein